ncbi:redoxin domain-containing protein [Lacipirellula sp.]|uniref:redoxin domain-containing protein n=1 Tax=Lacipirellula sp. TaxID=2691419 RepID=UPI003D0E123A
MDAPGFSSLPLRGFLLLLALAATATTGCNNSSDPAVSEESAAAEARGVEIAEKMLAAYRKASSYTDHATYVQSYAYRGEGVERELPFFEMSLAFRRPNFMRLRFDEAIPGEGPARGFDIASSRSVTRASAAELPRQILETKTPSKLNTENFLPDPMIREVFNNRSISDVFPQLAMLLNVDDETLVFPNDEAPRYLDDKPLDGNLCHRIVSTSANGKRTFWIDAKTYALRRMELPLGDARRDFDPDNQYSNLSVWIDFKDPTFDPDIERSTFLKEPAETDFLVKRLIPSPPQAPPERLGEDLADFSFETLDGEKVSRDSLKGKTVLLDFWQADCAPCKAHTPELEKVYQQLKDNDKFAFYAVSIDAPERVTNDTAARTLKNWGGSMPILRDPEVTAEALKVAGTPTLMLLDGAGKLQYFHIGQHRDPQQLANVISKVVAGADLAAEAHAEHQQLTDKYEADIKAAANAGDVVSVEIAQPEFGTQQLPAKFAASELWQAGEADVAKPGNFLILQENDSAEPRILTVDGGQAIIEFDAAGKLVARHDIAGNEATGNGFLRTTVDKAGKRLIAASGVGWQKLYLFDHEWKQTLAFPNDKNPGIADVQLAALTPDAEPMLYVGYWGGVGVQGVDLTGKRNWAIRSFNQVVQLAVAPVDLSNPPVIEEEDQDAAPQGRNLWGTSDRGLVFVLGPDGKPLPEIVVGLREIMHLAISPQAEGDDARCCALSVEAPGVYNVVGFDADGEVRWQYKLPTGEYTHQVERIQSVTLPGNRPAWMVAAPDGTIIWLDPAGQLIDQFRYAEPLTGLSLTNTPEAAILLVSTPESLKAWKLASKPQQ